MSVTPVAVPPTPSAVHRLATDEACAAEVAARRLGGFRHLEWSDADLGGSAGPGARRRSRPHGGATGRSRCSGRDETRPASSPRSTGSSPRCAATGHSPTSLEAASAASTSANPPHRDDREGVRHGYAGSTRAAATPLGRVAGGRGSRLPEFTAGQLADARRLASARRRAIAGRLRPPLRPRPGRRVRRCPDVPDGSDAPGRPAGSGARRPAATHLVGQGRRSDGQPDPRRRHPVRRQRRRPPVCVRCPDGGRSMAPRSRGSVERARVRRWGRGRGRSERGPPRRGGGDGHRAVAHDSPSST